MSKPTLLVVTSTFPRQCDDPDPPFVSELCHRLTRDFHVLVLAPHAPGLPAREKLGDIEVTRFRYCIEPLETLAYEGGILPRLRRAPWYWLLVPLFIAGQYIALRRTLRQRPVDILQAHWLIPQGILAAYATKRTEARPPVVCTSHGGDLFALAGRLPTMLKRYAMQRCTKLTVVSENMRRTAVAIGATPEKIEVIPMGVDLQAQFVPAQSAPDNRNLVFVGRLVEKKGVTYLLDAMKLLSERYPSINLTIVGDGPEFASLRQKCRGLDLQNRVVFTGAIPNRQITAHYQAAAIAVFPFTMAQDNDQEGFGLVLVEAMGCALPVVTTDLASIQDIALSEHTALIARHADGNSLAEQIARLLESPEFGVRLGRAARQYVLERFDWEVTAANYRDLLLSAATLP